MVQMDNFCPFASVFMMGKPAFFAKYLNPSFRRPYFSEPFYVSQTFIFKCGQRCGAADIVCRQPVDRRGRLQMVRPVFAIRQPAGHVHQPPAAHVCDCADGCVDGGGRHDYADFDAQPFCRTVDGGRKPKCGFGFAVESLLLPAAPLLAKMSVAAVAALIGMLVFMLLIRRLPPTAQLMVPLVGIIFGGVIEAVATFIAYENEMLQMLGVWQQGDFSGVLLGRYELLWATGILALFAYLIADQLTILGLGETVSVNLGLNRTAILWSGLIIVALITSLVVVTVGNIPFIGLGRAEHHQPPDGRQAAPEPACSGLAGRVFGIAVRYCRTRDCVSV